MVSTSGRVAILDHVENFFAGTGIEAVEHLGDCADAAVRLAAEFAECR